MADRHPSAVKRERQNERRRLRNQAVKSTIKSYQKKFIAAVDAEDWTAADGLLIDTASRLDRAGLRKIMHKNQASRKKSRMALHLKRAKEAAVTLARPSKRIVAEAAKTSTRTKKTKTKRQK